jgi:homoserine dehydrogenase
MKTIPIALTGFGQVSRAFVTLLREKEGDLQSRYGVRFAVMAVVKSEGCFFSG